MSRAGIAAAALAVAIGTYASIGSAAVVRNRVDPGDLSVEPPTQTSVGIEWRIDGDDNRDASVRVYFRKVGDAQWRQGMYLFRLQGERTLENNRFDVISPNMFAGSIIDL